MPEKRYLLVFPAIGEELIHEIVMFSDVERQLSSSGCDRMYPKISTWLEMSNPGDWCRQGEVIVVHISGISPLLLSTD